MKDTNLVETLNTPGASGDEAMRLQDGARVAVIGGGPAGSFFSYFLLDMAARAGLQIRVEIYEPRDFFKAGPTGCNMCAGIVSETLVQNLAAEGINLPGSVVQRGIDSYILHMDVGSARIDTPLAEKRIGAVYRGAGPRDLKEFKFAGLDGHLLRLAVEKGATVIPDRVSEITLAEGGFPQLKTRSTEAQPYDLVAVTAGVNSPALKLFEPLGLKYTPPGNHQNPHSRILPWRRDRLPRVGQRHPGVPARHPPAGVWDADPERGLHDRLPVGGRH